MQEQPVGDDRLGELRLVAVHHENRGKDAASFAPLAGRSSCGTAADNAEEPASAKTAPRRKTSWSFFMFTFYFACGTEVSARNSSCTGPSSPESTSGESFV